jgi:hypothetical protein
MEEQDPVEVEELLLSLDAAISRNDWREEPLDDGSALPLPITSDLTFECMDMCRVHEILSENSPPQPREFTLFPPPSRSRSI